jgi:UDP-glucose:(heptosyl)LPS alpha-1,3-glucosyltransferase
MITFLRLKKNSFGGAERYLSRLTNELKKQNITLETKHSSSPKFLPSWIKIIWFNIESCLFKKNKFYFSLERVLCSDIYRAGDGVHKVFVKKMNKSFLNPLHPVYIFIEKRVFKNSKKIIANSNMIKNEIIETYNIDQNKIEVIHNGIEISEKEKFEDLKKEFNLKNEKILLFIGSGFERKGVKEALEIASNLQTNFKFFIVGKEKKIDEYREYAKHLGIDKKVFFTGARKDVNKFYSMADIFLFPTHYEPFSNVILEALNFECVVFTTKQNGASEILENEFIMETPDDYNVSEKINFYLTNPNILENEKRKAKEKAKNFSIEKNVEKTLKVIYEVIN